MRRTPQDKPTDASELIRYGTISSVDLDAATCRAQLDEDSETGDIAWLESRMGKTRIWSPPSIGEQVILLCPEGELSAAIALRGVKSDQYPPPGNSIEENITFDDGAIISYDPENHILNATLPSGGKVNITAPADLTINAAGGATINADGGLTINADIQLNGKMTATDDVIAKQISLVDHVHDKVRVGTDKSGKPQ